MSTRYEQLSETKIRFGKFKGSTFAQVPISYVAWIAGQRDFSDVVLQMDAEEYLKLPEVRTEQQRQKLQEETDIKPIKRAWKGRR